MILATRTSHPSGSALLRSFRFDGLALARPGEAKTSPGERATGCDVFLALDFSGTSDTPLSERLAEAVRRVGPEGVVLLGLPNRFALRFWSGCPEPGTGKLFATLAGGDATTTPEAANARPQQFVSRQELAQALTAAGLVALEWFFAVPDTSADPARSADSAGSDRSDRSDGPGGPGGSDHREAGTLISERLVSVAPLLAAELATARPSADRLRPRLNLFPEVLAGRELARSGLFAEFASHFLVAATAAPAASAAGIWTRLRPPAQEVGWHQALDRREPVETVFELGESGVTAGKRHPSGHPALDLGRFRWTAAERVPIAPGMPLRHRLEEHLVAGRMEAFLDEVADFHLVIRQRFGTGEVLEGEALDALLTNAMRDSDGDFHLFDLEWSVPAGMAPSWWILRNVLACLEMRGLRLAGLANGADLYHRLCTRLGVDADLEADLARELEFGAAVRRPAVEQRASDLAAILARPWPVPVLSAFGSTELLSSVAAATKLRNLETEFHKLEAWATEVQRCQVEAIAEHRKLEAWATEVQRSQVDSLAERRKLEAWALELHANLLARDAGGAAGASSPAPAAAATRRSRVRAIVIHPRNAELLDHCLRAVLASSEVELDVVLFENECTEPLPAWVYEEPRVHRVGSPVMLGFGEANNRAVAWSQAQLPPVDAYFFLNNDAVVRADTVSILATTLDERPGAAAAGPLMLIWGAEDHLNSLGLNLSTAGEAWDEGIGLPLAAHPPPREREEVLAVTGSAVLIRRSAFETAGGWSQLYHFYMEDLDLCLRFRRHGLSVWLVPQAVVAHAVSATAGPNSEFKLFLFWRNRLILMFLHWPWRRLLRWLPELLRQEIATYRLRRANRDAVAADRQRRAWGSALALVPRILVQRLRHGRDVSWWALLKAPGTVPVIRLPEVVMRGRPWESVAAGETPR